VASLLGYGVGLAVVLVQTGEDEIDHVGTDGSLGPREDKVREV